MILILKNVNYVMDGATGHDTGHDGTVGAKRLQLLHYCTEEKSRDEMQAFLGISSRPISKKPI